MKRRFLVFARGLDENCIEPFMEAFNIVYPNSEMYLGQDVSEPLSKDYGFPTINHTWKKAMSTGSNLAKVVWNAMAKIADGCDIVYKCDVDCVHTNPYDLDKHKGFHGVTIEGDDSGYIYGGFYGVPSKYLLDKSSYPYGIIEDKAISWHCAVNHDDVADLLYGFRGWHKDHEMSKLIKNSNVIHMGQHYKNRSEVPARMKEAVNEMVGNINNGDSSERG